MLPKEWFDKTNGEDKIVGGLQAVARYLVGLASSAHASSLGFDENYRKRIRLVFHFASNKNLSPVHFSTTRYYSIYVLSYTACTGDCWLRNLKFFAKRVVSALI